MLFLEGKKEWNTFYYRFYEQERPKTIAFAIVQRATTIKKVMWKKKKLKSDTKTYFYFLAKF